MSSEKRSQIKPIPGLEVLLKKWIQSNESYITQIQMIIGDRFEKGSCFDGIVSRADNLRVQMRDVMRLMGYEEKQHEVKDCNCED